MTSTDRVAVSRTVKATPAEVFRILTDPTLHVEIDGSGMLEAAPDASRLDAVGDTFRMEMDRAPLGEIRKYKVINTVTKIVPDTLLEWVVGVPGRGPLGHVYGWEITPVSADESEVTNYCDWSGATEEMLRRFTFPVVPVAMLEQSVENLARLVARESARRG